MSKENNFNENYKEFLDVKDEYAEQKQEFLDKKGQDNIIFNYLEKNKDQIGSTLNYILSTIYKAFKKGVPNLENNEIENSDCYITTFFTHQYIYPYLVYLDSLISNYKEMKYALFYILSDHEDEEDTG